MQRLNEIVDFYLKTNTNYALMITGDWGIGKTYYFKNTLKKQIALTSTFDDNSKKYKPILISLFGIKSVEEIQTEIFLSIYPLLKNKTVKLGANIVKSLIKGIMHLNKLGDFNDYVSEIVADKSDWIMFSELVICFDDLERLSQKFNIEELIGYVNSLVENENVKVIVIANENKIKSLNYSKLKEKVVGNSIEFIPDLGISYDSLVEDKFIGFPSYKTFLNEYKEIILNIYFKESNNLRTLSFVLIYFQTIFSEISSKLLENDILKEREIEILKMLLKFSLAISIEYKEGKISFTKKEKLDLVTDMDMYFKSFLENSPLNNNNKKNEVKENIPFREKFIEQYYQGNNYHYFNSIYDFLTGGDIFNYENLYNELKTYYHIEENKVLPQYDVFNRLNYTNVFSLSDNEYNQLTKKMLEYSDRGIYDISNYISVFFFATRFDNPLRFNLEKLEKRIIKGMKKGKENYKFNPFLASILNIDSNAFNKDYLIRIKNVAIELNEKLKNENHDMDLKRLETLCYNDFDLFCNEFFKNQKFIHQYPTFQSFNPHKFYLFFLKSNNYLRWQIVNFWSGRYMDNQSKELKNELEFLKKLKQKIEKRISNKTKKGVTYYLFNEFAAELNKSINKFEPKTK